MNIIGLDLSFSATGASTPGGAHVFKTAKKHGCDITRSDHIASRVVDLIGIIGGEVVVWMEDLPSRGYSIHRLGVLHGVVRHSLWKMDLTVIRIAPGKLKKYATGKGNAGKEAVIVAAVKRLGYEGHDDNEADASWLRQMGLCAHGLPHVEMPALNRSALDGVDLTSSPSSASATDP